MSSGADTTLLRLVEIARIAPSATSGGENKSAHDPLASLQAQHHQQTLVALSGDGAVLACVDRDSSPTLLRFYPTSLASPAAASSSSPSPPPSLVAAEASSVDHVTALAWAPVAHEWVLFVGCVCAMHALQGFVLWRCIFTPLSPFIRFPDPGTRLV